MNAHEALCHGVYAGGSGWIRTRDLWVLELALSYVNAVNVGSGQLYPLAHLQHRGLFLEIGLSGVALLYNLVRLSHTPFPRPLLLWANSQ